MSYYHMSMSNVSRAAGSTSIATASYITGESIHDEILEKTYSYGNKDRILEHDIVLPMHADHKLNNPEALFNSIENFETADNARTAKKIIVALPEECDSDTHKKIIKDFIKENITAEGYACCYALHLNNAGTNPHAHILIPNRQIDSKGKWAKIKTSSQFVLDEQGKKIPVIDPATGKQKVGARNRKVWKRINVSANPLDRKEKLQSMRESWAICCNKYLSEENQITHLSHKERGLITKPTIHEGYYARKIESEGKISYLCERNRQIREDNKKLLGLVKEQKNVEHKINNEKFILNEIDKGEKIDAERNKWNAKQNEWKNKYDRQSSLGIVFAQGYERKNSIHLFRQVPPRSEDNSLFRLSGSNVDCKYQARENATVSLPLTRDNVLQQSEGSSDNSTRRMHSETNSERPVKAVPTAPAPAAKAMPEPGQQTLQPTPRTVIEPPTTVSTVRTRTRTRPGAKKPLTAGNWLSESRSLLINTKLSIKNGLKYTRNPETQQRYNAAIKYCTATIKTLTNAITSGKAKTLNVSGASIPTPPSPTQPADKSLLDILKWASNAESSLMGKDLGIVGMSARTIEDEAIRQLEQSARDPEIDMD